MNYSGSTSFASMDALGDCPKSLEAISQIPKQDDDAPELHEAEVVLRSPLVAHYQPSEVTQPGKEALYFPAPLVASEFAAVLCLGLLPVPSMRSDHLYAPLPERLIEWIQVIGPVSDQPLWFLLSATRCKSCLYERDLVPRSARRVYAERKARSVCQHHELRTLAPFGRSY